MIPSRRSSPKSIEMPDQKYPWIQYGIVSQREIRSATIFSSIIPLFPTPKINKTFPKSKDDETTSKILRKVDNMQENVPSPILFVLRFASIGTKMSYRAQELCSS